MNLKLPVEVHLSVSPTGAFALTVGGFTLPVSPQDLAVVMRGQAEEPPAPVPLIKPRSFPSGKRMGRPPAPMCRYGDAKAAPGKKLCPKHQAIAVKSVAKARLAKKRAS